MDFDPQSVKGRVLYPWIRFLALIALPTASFVSAQDNAKVQAPAEPLEESSAASGVEANAAFTVANIDIDIAGKTAEAARFNAFREAQRRAWPQLWSRLSGSPVSAAPKLGDSALDAIVAGIEVEAERFSTQRYIGRLAVVFDGARAAKYFGDSARVLSSRPMLLMPVLDDGGARIVYEAQSPWLKAWARFRSPASPIQYVRASTVAGDAILLGSWQARRGNRELWRNIMARFRTADVLIAEARLDRRYPGGPVNGTFTARHGPDGILLGRFSLRTGSAAGVDAMLDEATRRVDLLYTAALRAGQLKSEAALSLDLAAVESSAPVIATESTSGVEVLVATPNAAALAALDTSLDAAPTVSGTTIVSLSLGGTSRIRIGYSDSYQMLLWGLDQRGWRLQPGQGGMVLRRRTAGEAAVPKPVVIEAMPAVDASVAPAKPVVAAPKAGASLAKAPAKPATAPPPSKPKKGPADLLPPAAR